MRDSGYQPMFPETNLNGGDNMSSFAERINNLYCGVEWSIFAVFNPEISDEFSETFSSSSSFQIFLKHCKCL